MLKRKIGKGVSRAARLVIDRYYLQNHGRPLSKERLNVLVKRVEREAVPLILSALREEADAVVAEPKPRRSKKK